MEAIDVLIVGAGPTGLCAALECARFGLRFKIIESKQEPSSYSKAIAIQPRTLETFQRMGIHHPFLDAGHPLKGGTIRSNHKVQAHIDFSSIQSPFPFVLALEQNKTEAILTEALSKQEIHIERGTSLISFENSSEYILAKTNKETLQVKYLIGCDGAHSIVRKTLNCTFQGKSFPGIFSLADVHLDWPFSHDEISVFLETQGVLAAFPLPEEGRYRLIFQLKRLRTFSGKSGNSHGVVPEDESNIPTLQEIQTILQSSAHTQTTVSDPKWIANFHINSRLSGKYQEKNVFLVGDAAHIHSPVGGQGMNTGIQDAFNLIWKIASVHIDRAPKSLLSTYEKERRTLGKQLLFATEFASKIVTTHSKILLTLRNFILSKILRLQTFKKRLTKSLAELNIGYPLPRVPNYTALIQGKEIPYHTLSEGCTKYHILSNQNTFKNLPAHMRGIQIKEQLPQDPMLVRPDGYPTQASQQR